MPHSHECDAFIWRRCLPSRSSNAQKTVSVVFCGTVPTIKSVKDVPRATVASDGGLRDSIRVPGYHL